MTNEHRMGLTPDQVIAALQRHPARDNHEWWEEDSSLESLLNRPRSIEERIRLKGLLYGQFATTRGPYKLGHRIEMWERFVRGLAVTDIDEEMEYTSPLFQRSKIEGLGEQLPDPLKHEVRCVLDAIDNEFRSMTVAVEKPVLPGINRTLGWWEYRLPCKGATWL